MKIQTAIILTAATASLKADPQLTTWFTDLSSKYARVYLTDTDATSGTSTGVVTATFNITAEVRDTRTGIPAADLPRIFDRFHRGDNPAPKIAAAAASASPFVKPSSNPTAARSVSRTTPKAAHVSASTSLA